MEKVGNQLNERKRQKIITEKIDMSEELFTF
jgi:hypothetical protein